MWAPVVAIVCIFPYFSIFALCSFKRWSDEVQDRNAYLQLHSLYPYSIFYKESRIAVLSCNFQHEFSVKFWAALNDDLVIGPVVLPIKLNAECYLQYLMDEMQGVLQDVPLNIRLHMLFQMDRASLQIGLPSTIPDGLVGVVLFPGYIDQPITIPLIFSYGVTWKI